MGDAAVDRMAGKYHAKECHQYHHIWCIFMYFVPHFILIINTVFWMWMWFHIGGRLVCNNRRILGILQQSPITSIPSLHQSSTETVIIHTHLKMHHPVLHLTPTGPSITTHIFNRNWTNHHYPHLNLKHPLLYISPTGTLITTPISNWNIHYHTHLKLEHSSHHYTHLKMKHPLLHSSKTEATITTLSPTRTPITTPILKWNIHNYTHLKMEYPLLHPS